MTSYQVGKAKLWKEFSCILLNDQREKKDMVQKFQGSSRILYCIICNYERWSKSSLEMLPNSAQRQLDGSCSRENGHLSIGPQVQLVGCWASVAFFECLSWLFKKAVSK